MDVMPNFTYDAPPMRILFGSGKINSLTEELSRRGLSATLLLSTPQQVDQIELLKTNLGAFVGGTFTEAAMHTPISITEKAIEYAKAVKADSVVSLGGGSTIGLGKAIGIRTGLPHICIPTTYAGSEMTPILGETQGGKKTVRSDPKIRPDTVIYDVELTFSLPVGLSVTSGINAMAHAVEALYAQNSNPIISLLALEGVKALSESLPIIVDSPSDPAARTAVQYGAWLCGLCLGSVGVALHHKICHTLGGSFNLPHAETHTIVLPHALAYNAPKIPRVMEQLANVLPESNGDAIRGLNNLLARLKWKRGLKDFGFKEEDIDKAADITVSNPYFNPREIERDLVRELIRRAYAGEEARVNI